MNVFTATARLAADAELRSAGNSPVASVRLAIDAGFGDRKSTLWITGSMWGARAEKLAPMLRKGAKVVVSGELSQRDYTAKDGSKGSSLELNIREIEFAGPRQEAAETPPPVANGTSPHPRQLEDEIPF